MSPKHLDRARKIAAHAAYDTNEGRTARRILGEFLLKFPELAGEIGWRVGEDGAAEEGPAKAAPPRRKRVRQDKREYQLRTSHQAHLVGALRQKHGLRLRWIQGIVPGEPVRVEVSGPAPAVAAFEAEWSRHHDVLEAMFGELAAVYCENHFPGSFPEWEPATRAEPNPYNPEAATKPKRNAWMLRALDWERRVLRARTFIDLERFREGVRRGLGAL